MYPDEKLVAAIRGSFTAGMSREKIEEALRAAGWLPGVIEKGFMLAGPEENYRPQEVQSPEAAEIAATAAKILADLEQSQHIAKEERANSHLVRKRGWFSAFLNRFSSREIPSSSDIGLVDFLIRIRLARNTREANTILIIICVLIFGAVAVINLHAPASTYGPPPGFTPIPQELLKGATQAPLPTR